LRLDVPGWSRRVCRDGRREASRRGCQAIRSKKLSMASINEDQKSGLPIKHIHPSGGDITRVFWDYYFYFICIHF
jgi:hypothetical protein